MDYRGFIKYMNDFYGPKRVYPDKKKRTLGQKEIGMAYSDRDWETLFGP